MSFLPFTAAASTPPESAVAAALPPLFQVPFSISPPPCGIASNGLAFHIPPLRKSNKRAAIARVAKSLPAEGLWEAPDAGYGGEWVDDEEEEAAEEEREGREEGNGSYVDAGRDSSSDSENDREIPAEIEMLLSAKEKAILEQSEVSRLDKISTEKWIPLHTLALSLQIPALGKLLQNGMDIDAVDKDGYTALHKAVICKKEAVISHLLRRGANPHCKDRNGATPLHFAVQVGAMQTVKLLIKYKADVNHADNDGWTPLHVALQSRSRDIAKVLLINGADKTRKNRDGKTPLDISLCYGKDFKSYELAKLLKLVPANRDL